MFCLRKYNKKMGKKCKKRTKKEVSPAGNRTRVFHVTGGDTHHYTTEDLREQPQKTILNYINHFLFHKHFITYISGILLNDLFHSTLVLALVTSFSLLITYSFELEFSFLIDVDVDQNQ